MIPRQIPKTSPVTSPRTNQGLTPPQASRVLQEPRNHHTDKPCVIVMVIGEPSPEELARVQDCEREAGAQEQDFGAIVVKELDDTTRTLMANTLQAAKRDRHTDKPLDVLVWRCGGSGAVGIGLLQLPLEGCRVKDLASNRFLDPSLWSPTQNLSNRPQSQDGPSLQARVESRSLVLDIPPNG